MTRYKYTRSKICAIWIRIADQFKVTLNDCPSYVRSSRRKTFAKLSSKLKTWGNGAVIGGEHFESTSKATAGRPHESEPRVRRAPRASLGDLSRFTCTIGCPRCHDTRAPSWWRSSRQPRRRSEPPTAHGSTALDASPASAAARRSCHWATP